MRKWALYTLLTLVLVTATGTSAQFIKGASAPSIDAVDIYGNTVNLDALIQKGRAVIILFFFSEQTGEEMAAKLATLDTLYGGEELEVIGLGVHEDADALKKLARDFQIEYYLIENSAIADTPWYKTIESLPLTLFVVTENKTIGKVLRGGSHGAVLQAAAETFFQRGEYAQAQTIADKALASDENTTTVAALRGHILLAQGKLDEAEKEFGRINSTAGLAKTALTRGNVEEAIVLAERAPQDGYAKTIKGKSLLYSGKLDEAQAVLQQAEQLPQQEWQTAETYALQGRVAQEKGQLTGALASYEQAISLDPYNVVALSNEGTALHSQGKLEEAEQILTRASKIRPDSYTQLLLQQVRQEMAAATAVQRGELIRTQIAALQERFEALKKDENITEADTWTSRPLVVALLPPTSPPPFFERAGMDRVILREIEGRLQTDARINVVEREMLQQLLQELQLGSSDLANPDTQRRLGRVLSAGLLGFVDFAQAGIEKTLYIRLVDTETTELAFQTSAPIHENNINATITGILTPLQQALLSERKLQGYIADASQPDAIIINIGSKHGVTPKQIFTVLTDGAPIEVGGRVIAHRQQPVGQIQVNAIEDTYAICSIVKGNGLKKEMKIKALPQ